MSHPGSHLRRPCSSALPYACSPALLRYGSHPFTACWTPADLAYHNLAPAGAFDRQAQQVTITGIIDSYPLLVDGKQELYVATQTMRFGARMATDFQPVTERQLRGAVRVTRSDSARLHYGQHVSVSGRRVEPGVFDDFSYKD